MQPTGAAFWPVHLRNPFLGVNYVSEKNITAQQSVYPPSLQAEVGLCGVFSPADLSRKGRKAARK